MFCSPPSSNVSSSNGRHNLGSDEDQWAGPRDAFIANRFSVRGIIGQGSTGIVYCAKQRTDGKQVALKVIHPSNKKQEDAQREYERLQMLQHPNIVKALGFLSPDGTSVLVLEYIPGLQLPSAVQQAPGERLSELNARELCSMLLQAVSHMHERGLVHGDLKPADVLVSEDLCQLKLVDLGSAFEASSALPCCPPVECAEAQATRAPEVLLGGPPSQFSDVWQVGLCLFIMLVGKIPKEFNSGADLPDKSSRILKRCRISSHDPRLWHLTDACKSVLRSCLKVDKLERPTAEELLGGEWICNPRPPSAALRRSPTGPVQDGSILLPGLEPVSPGGRPSRPQSARPRRARPEQEQRSSAAERSTRRGKTLNLCPLDKNLAAPLSQTSTQPSSCRSLQDFEYHPLSDPILSVQEHSTVEIWRSRMEVAKVLLANRVEGTYKVRMGDGSVRTVTAGEAKPTLAVEIVRPKWEMAKVLMENRLEGTYKVRLADGSTRVVSAEDVECSSSVEVLQPHRETVQVLLANRMDGTYKVRMRDGSVEVVSAEEVHVGAYSANGQ